METSRRYGSCISIYIRRTTSIQRDLQNLFFLGLLLDIEERITKDLHDTFIDTIPNRLLFFDSLKLNMSPYVLPTTFKGYAKNL